MTIDDGTNPRNALFDTSPPEPRPSRAVRLKQLLVARASSVVMPIVRKAAGPYIGGETLAEALGVIGRLSGEGRLTTLGYWDRSDEAPGAVAEAGVAAAESLSGYGSSRYVSLKPPALHFDGALAGRLAEAAAASGIGLHCDSHGIEVADLSNAFAETLGARLGFARVGVTLPGRWSRSLTDAGWAAAQGFAVRVVKGQWPDPADPRRDVAQGFLDVIARLCGRARRVEVATHDFALGTESLARLKIARTPCELAVLLGMPAGPLVAWARQNAVPVRVYVPYGPGFVPNAIGVLRRNPRLVMAVAKERISAAARMLRPR